MTVLTNLNKVKAISADDAAIQNLKEDSTAVEVVFALVDKLVPISKFSALTEEAQTYYAAHLLSLAHTAAGGQGPVSSESIGGITTSFTLPYLNQQTVVASTQYGLFFLELRNSIIPKSTVI